MSRIDVAAMSDTEIADATIDLADWLDEEAADGHPTLTPIASRLRLALDTGDLATCRRLFEEVNQR